ncbi:MAG: MFS transporter [Anaerolineales bacterium]
MNLADRLGINRIVFAISVARMADALGNSLLFIVIPLYVAQLPAPAFTNLPESVLVGILISAYGLMFSLLQPLSGAISDRVSRRKPFILGGLIIMAASSLAFLAASRFSHLLVIRLVQGLGVAITVPAALALMTSATEKRTRGGSMGIYSAMRMVGFALGPLVGGYLQVTYGFTSVFIAGGVTVLLGALMVQLFVDEPAEPTRGKDQGPLQLFDLSLFNREIVSLGTATFLMASAYSMITTLENEFNARLDQTAIGFGIAFSALTFSRLIFQIPLGRLSDRIGRKPVIIAGLILMAPATALLGLVISTLQLTGLRAVQGIAAAAIAAPAFALAGDLAHEGGEGQQMSLLAMGFGLGIALGPLVAGFLAVYSLELPFLIGGAMTILGAWIVHAYVPETVFPDEQSGEEPVAQIGEMG